jgi:para-nitrobenzyl esterase
MIAETTAGRVRGAAAGPVTAYLGIPYADADRFAVPRPVRA